MRTPLFSQALPKNLEPIIPPSTEAEILNADGIRKKYLVAGEQPPIMSDISRAFRLAKGKKTYIEVGSRDKGNVAWVSQFLAEDALIIEIDIDKYGDAEKQLRHDIKPMQKLVTLTGDCLSDVVVNAVKKSLSGAKADIIFCDTLHWYTHCIEELATYLPFLADDGFLFVHDAFWPGDANDLGKAHAFSELDRIKPIYSILRDEPPSRYLRRGGPTPVWGGLAIVTA